MTIPATMRALQLRAIGDFGEAELPVPSPRPDEVLIRTLATTICTSDLTDITHNPFGTPLPRVLGHEGAGVVAAVGAQVREFRIGERVAAHPVIPCGRCENCRRGLGHLCDHMGHLALDREGTFAEFFAMPARRARRIPDNLDLAVAALVEPVAVCLEAVRRARVAAGERVLVVGDGPFGIMIARLARRQGPKQVILVGRHDFRLGQVPEAVVINEKRQGALAALREIGGVDAAILAASSAPGVHLCLEALRARGRLVIFSGMLEPVPVDLFRLHVKELEILGACNDEGYLDEALACLGEADLKLGSVITHRVPFADWQHGIELASRGKDQALKVALIFGAPA